MFSTRQPLVHQGFRVGGGGRNRTDEYSFCRAVPYHLATPPICRQKRIFICLQRKSSFVSPFCPLPSPTLCGASFRLTPPYGVSRERFFHRPFGLIVPTGVMIPVINSGGVTSNPGLRARLDGLAIRT